MSPETAVGAAPTRDRRAQAGTVGQSMIDQGLSSATQMLLLVLVARSGTVAEFGSASAVLLVHGLLLGVQRAALGDVALLRLRRAGTDPDDAARAGLAAALAFSAVEAAILLSVAGFTGGATRALLVTAALAAPAVCVQDMLRSLAYGRVRVVEATIVDATWLAVQVAASAILLATAADSAVTLVAAWGAGAAAGMVVGLARTRHRPSWRALQAWRREDAPRSRTFFADYMSDSGASILANLGLGGIIGAADFGALRVALTSVMPPTNLMASTRSLVLGRIGGHEDEPGRALRTALQAGCAFGFMSLVYGAVLVLMPTAIGVAVFGESWDDAVTVVGIVAAAEALRFAGLPAVDVIRALGKATTLVRTRLVLTGGLVGATVVGGFVSGLGVVWWVLAARAVGVAVWWWQAAEVARSRQRSRRAQLEQDLFDDSGASSHAGA